MRAREASPKVPSTVRAEVVVERNRGWAVGEKEVAGRWNSARLPITERPMLRTALHLSTTLNKGTLGEPSLPRQSLATCKAPLRHPGYTVKPSWLAAVRRVLSVVTISVSPATRAEARWMASNVRSGTGGVRR